MTSSVKVIFLDIDDVLNTRPTRERGELFDSVNVAALNVVLDRTSAMIVVTSTWRLSATAAEWEEILTSAGIHACERVLGVTPWIEGISRGAEIAYWLENALCDVAGYMIIDDRDDMEPCKEHLLRTSPDKGLTHVLANLAISRLD